MLPTSTRTAGITYTLLLQGLRTMCYVNSLTITGRTDGFLLVHWARPQKHYQYSRNAFCVAPLAQALHRTHPEGTLLIMSARNDDRDRMREWDLCRDDSISVNSVASSADQEEYYARATAAATRSQNLTVIISQLDIMGIMGMIQVLAAGAHPVQEVYQAQSNWTMPLLRSNETQLEQFDREIAGRLNHAAGAWIFFLRLPIGHDDPVNRMSIQARRKITCTWPCNWDETRFASERNKNLQGPIYPGIPIPTRNKEPATPARSPPRHPGTPRPGSQVHGYRETQRDSESLT